MPSRSKNLVKRVMEAGEARIDRVVSQLLANENFVAAVQGVVSRSLAAKGTIDKSLRSALSTMNLPTSQDVAALGRRLDRLERSLGEIDGRLSRLEAEGAGPAAAAKPAKKPASPAAKGAEPKKAAARGSKAPAGGKTTKPKS